MRPFLAILTASLTLAASAAAAQDFQWRGQLTSGQTLEIKGINGDIKAAPSGSGQVEVTAVKSARRSNPADVRVIAVPHAGGVTICAVYPDVPGREPNTCEPGTGGRSTSQNNDTVVHFDVRVPSGIAFVPRTVNGEIEAQSLQADTHAHTVNGSIRISTTGLATASTVNGSVNVTAGRADWTEDATFKTVNGEITLAVPALDAELSARTLNGSITSDFPITVTREISRRRLSGTIGAGGHRLEMSTVNGSIKLLRGQ